MDVAERKRRMRSEASKLRTLAHEKLKDRAGWSLAARGLPFAPLGCISGVFSIRSEIPTQQLLDYLVDLGWVLAMPVVLGEGLPLTFRKWQPGEPTVPSIWNIPVPAETSPEVLPDVLLVPMLAFDRLGFRLGYGGGFYDRTLAKLRAIKPVIAIGVAYAAQEVAEVPREPSDQPLDFIMTEKETFACG